VGLCRKYGSWPCEEFKALTQLEQQAFWAQNDQSLEQQVAQVLEKRYVEERKVQEGGSYLPLGCYVAQGYSAERVQATTDKKWHNELGEWVFEISIESSSKSKVAQDVRSHMLRLTDEGNRKRKQLRTKGAAAGSGGVREASASSSSDSSDKQKKKKKKKKDGKHKKDDSHASRVKALDQERKQQEKQMAKLKRVAVTEATRVVAKTAPMLIRAEHCVGDPFFKGCPSTARAGAIKMEKQLRIMKGEAESRMRDGGSLSFSMEQLRQLDDDFKERIKLCEDLMATMRKHGASDSA
jgi:hypothetical protein